MAYPDISTGHVFCLLSSDLFIISFYLRTIPCQQKSIRRAAFFMISHVISQCRKLPFIPSGFTLTHLALGQFLSFVVSTTGMFTTFLINEFAFHLPMLQCLFVYLILFLSCCLLRRCISIHRIHGTTNTRLWKLCAIVAFCDANANILIVYAYQFSDMPTIQLLMCFSVPCVMVLTFIVHRFSNFRQVKPKRIDLLGDVSLCKNQPKPSPKPLYTPLQYIAAGICIAGIAFLIVTDAIHTSQKLVQFDGKRMVGDIFTIVGVTLYAISNVGCEWILKHSDGHFSESTSHDTSLADSVIVHCPKKQSRVIPIRLLIDYLYRLGALGSLICFVEICIFECVLLVLPNWYEKRHVYSFLAFEWRSSLTGSFCGYFGGFGLTMVVIYFAIPLLLFMSSATFLNLSLLTAQFYTLLWASLFFAYVIRQPFVLSFLLTIFGAALYECS
ncbi:hypothetical protein XU18_0269 [Perkinsela sp. CCAP 1560/4]|nr:hypothetical protein XU18_0269 [Perkinsela sp. CCAP 1560/4]|eukprot:KNH09584.1 hypothetical protein XU18_0269 [Perkinsela sp. CCAP 1560/4]